VVVVTYPEIPPRRAAPLAVAWLGAVAAASAGLMSLSLIDQIVLLAVAVVLPLAVGGRTWWWAATAGGAIVGFVLPRGPAALAVVPFVVAAAAALASRLRAAGSPRGWDLDRAAPVVAAAYALVAAGALAWSRGGVALFGVREPFVELTAVHYAFAGAGALVLAARARAAAPPGGGRRRLAGVAVVLTAGAPPVVAAGFVTGAAAPQVGGAVLMALGVAATAAAELAEALASAARREPGRALLLAVSGLAVWAPMALAVAWAAGQHWAVPALSVPDMARTHGLPNALAFTLCGLVARREPAEAQPPRWRWRKSSVRRQARVAAASS
jgi:YndJ-like protein